MKTLLALILVSLGVGARSAALSAPATRQDAPSATPIVRMMAGAGPAQIQPAIDLFRADLGGTNNGVGGSYTNGWREIGWDEVPDAEASPNLLPPDYYNTAAPQGVVLETPGTGFAVSANEGVAPIYFGDLTLSYADLFTSYSPQRLFTPLGSTETDVTFFVPGTDRAATVSGFGLVFTNVRLDDAASVECFDANGNSLGRWSAPPDGGGGLSFLGVAWSNGAPIARVRITSGTVPLAAGVTDGGTTNVVALDDFIYGEPRPAP
jgi:hypothetical protein